MNTNKKSKKAKQERKDDVLLPKLSFTTLHKQAQISKNVKAPSKSRIYKDINLPAIEKCRAEEALSKANEILLNAHKEREGKRAEFDEKWKQIEKKQILFRKTFITFSEFVEINIMKRKRTQQKIEEEMNLYEGYCNDIETLKKNIEKATEYKLMREVLIKKYKIYENFLNDAVSQSNFKNIERMMEHYHILIETKNNIFNNSLKLVSTMQEFKNKSEKNFEEKVLIFMKLKMQCSSLKARYDKAIAKTLKWEMIISLIREKIIQIDTELCHTISGVDRIYTAICERQSETPSKNVSIDFKLNFINYHMVLWEKIIRKYSKQKRKAGSVQFAKK